MSKGKGADERPLSTDAEGVFTLESALPAMLRVHSHGFVLVGPRDAFSTHDWGKLGMTVATIRPVLVR